MFTRQRARQLFAFAVFIILASLDNAAMGVLPPLYAIIARDLQASDAALGSVTAVYLLVVAGAAVLWGYRGDQQKRKPLLFWGTLVWVAAMLLTTLSTNITQFLLFQMITAVGVGGISSLGFSVVSDLVPARRRGLALSLWSVSQGIGASFGALLAGTVGAFDWRYPFWTIAAIGLLFALLFLLTREPLRGRAEPELEPIFAQGKQYNFRISRSDIKLILQQASNRWLLLQSFFYALAYGSTVWIPRWAIARVQAEGYDLETATIVGNLIIALLSLGGFTAVLSGHLGDWWQQRSSRGRVKLAMIGTFVSAPLYVWLYLIPFRNLDLPEPATLWQLVTAVLQAFVTNEWVILAFLVAFTAVTFQSADPPNWSAMITDVNLPEHRGTVIGLSRVFRAVGNAISVWLAGWLFAFLTGQLPEPDNYAVGLSLFQILVIPALLCYLILQRHIAADRQAVIQKLTSRAQNPEN
ncbi:MAG: MFS transporter [Ardenticatenaceae bacterium]|nr:MFS transporter [Ardenticatenaceae bacterium]MCB8946582.1 MFS transporter [Ardenticatenaceae bacterium]